MKNLSNIIVAALLITSATSCSEDKFNDASASGEEKTITLTGYYVNDKDSRSLFNNSEKKFYWDNDDFITLWNASGASVNIPITSGGGTTLGVFSGSVSSSFNPSYVTFAKSVGETANNQTKSISVNSISPNLYNARLHSLPDLSYGMVTISENGKYTFSLNHKMAYVYLKNVSVDGVAVNQVKVCTNIGNMSVNASGLITQTNLRAADATVKVGTIIPVMPTILGIATNDGTTTIIGNTMLEAGEFYIIDKNITTTSTETYAADNSRGKVYEIGNNSYFYGFPILSML